MSATQEKMYANIVTIVNLISALHVQHSIVCAILTPEESCKEMGNCHKKVEISTLTHRAIMPRLGSAQSTGLDLASPENYTIAPHNQTLIYTNLQMTFPKGYFGKIECRSGLALKRSLLVLGGVLDRDFRGDVAVILYNLGDKEVRVKRGDYIAQILIIKNLKPQYKLVPKLAATDRGSRGFSAEI